MNIKVLGPGCPNCRKLESNVKSTVESLGIQATVEEVTDYAEIMKFGIMRTPGLVVDGKVKVSGRVPSLKEIAEILQSSR